MDRRRIDALPGRRSYSRGHRRLGGWFLVLTMGMGFLGSTTGLEAQDPPPVIELTMERMVELTMSSSFRVRRLNMDVQRDQYNLQAERARLKSSVDLDLTIPAFRLTSEPRWNSTLEKDVIIQENTRRWEGELSVRQPVILFGYPTNGYLSFNNRMYRYNQIDDDGEADVAYYNRYYISYTQPLFQPNGLKNDLEQAEMNLEGTQLEFFGDVIEIVDNVAEGYLDLLEENYMRDVNRALVANIERALEIAQTLAQADSSRVPEVDQVQVELANARENVQSSESSIRLAYSYLKRELGLSDADSVVLVPIFHLDPVPVDMEEATRYAVELTPRMRQLAMALRNSEIRFEESVSRGGFRMNLNMSYGRERRDEFFDKVFVDPDNSYTVNVTAFIPVWDWGERKARLASSRIGIDQSLLRIEETEIQIVSGVRNEVLNVQDRESRTMAMRENLELARGVSETSFDRYQTGAISALELILNLRREADTAENFIDSYLGWRGSLRRLNEMTYWDFERGRPLLEHFEAQGWIPGNGFNGSMPTP
ncbi:TolC family protein [Gemmatimonadota bacterium]